MHNMHEYVQYAYICGLIRNMQYMTNMYISSIDVVLQAKYMTRYEEIKIANQHTFVKVLRMSPASSFETVFEVQYANVSATDRVINLAFRFR